MIGKKSINDNLVYSNEDLGHILKPDVERINNFPLNSSDFIYLNNFRNEKSIESINGGFILRNIIPDDFFGGNFALFKKCLSNVNNTRFSDLANSNICLSFEPNLTLFISNLSLDNISISSKGIFSSAKREILE